MTSTTLGYIVLNICVYVENMRWCHERSYSSEEIIPVGCVEIFETDHCKLSVILIQASNNILQI